MKPKQRCTSPAERERIARINRESKMRDYGIFDREAGKIVLTIKGRRIARLRRDELNRAAADVKVDGVTLPRFCLWHGGELPRRSTNHSI